MAELVPGLSSTQLILWVVCAGTRRCSGRLTRRSPSSSRCSWWATPSRTSWPSPPCPSCTRYLNVSALVIYNPACRELPKLGLKVFFLGGWEYGGIGPWTSSMDSISEWCLGARVGPQNVLHKYEPFLPNTPIFIRDGPWTSLYMYYF
jgi:hypothetical protein